MFFYTIYITQLSVDVSMNLSTHSLILHPAKQTSNLNERTNTLEKETLIMNVKNLKIPYTDWRSKINDCMRNRWQRM